MVKIWEELHELVKRGILVEVQHVNTLHEERKRKYDAICEVRHGR